MKLITREFNTDLITFDLSSDMMISLTDIAKANGKQVKHWLENQSTKEYLDEYGSVVGIPTTDLLVVKQGGTNQGTWANQDIALYFAQWCSPKFHIWCNNQIKELLTKGVVAMPTSYRDAIAQLLIEIDAKEEAIRTKAEIGDRRQATAMNTASQLSKQLDKAKDFATIKRIESITGTKYNWRELKKASVANDYPVNDVFDANYGTVKSYHADAWLDVYGVDITEFK